MRLKPVEKPTTLMGRMDYWMSKRETGKVISPLSVVYARVPTSLRLVHEMSKLAEKGLSLDPELRFLIQHYVARLNGCGFCIDIGEAMAQRADAASRLPRVADFETDETFTDAERAALRYVKEVTERKHVSDRTFDSLKLHFTDEQIVEITLLNAVENFWNLTNIPLEIESDGLCTLGVAEPPVRATA